MIQPFTFFKSPCQYHPLIENFHIYCLLYPIRPCYILLHSTHHHLTYRVFSLLCFDHCLLPSLTYTLWEQTLIMCLGRCYIHMASVTGADYSICIVEWMSEQITLMTRYVGRRRPREMKWLSQGDWRSVLAERIYHLMEPRSSDSHFSSHLTTLVCISK